jgi:starch phosphorylase
LRPCGARKHPRKAHPRDGEGKRLIEEINSHIRTLKGAVPAVFLPNYDMDLAKILVAGADLWLNTPQAPMEASGISGMKAALNGVLSISTLDGWWIEACIEGGHGLGNRPKRRCPVLLPGCKRTV